MNKINTFTLLLGFLSLCLIPPRLLHADKIVLVADSWCPYNCEPNSDKPGIFIELARRVFAEKGHEIEYKVLPWTRAVEGTKLGKYNAAIGAFKEDAPDFIFPEFTPVKAGVAFFKLSANKWFFDNSIDSLQSQTVGIVQDYHFSGEMADYVSKYSKDPKRIQAIKGSDALPSQIEKLLNHRITVIAEDPNVVEYYLTRHNLVDKIVRAGRYSVNESYLAFSPVIAKSGEYAKIFSEGTRKLVENGEYESILKKYVD